MIGLYVCKYRNTKNFGAVFDGLEGLHVLEAGVLLDDATAYARGRMSLSHVLLHHPLVVAAVLTVRAVKESEASRV